MKTPPLRALGFTLLCLFAFHAHAAPPTDFGSAEPFKSGDTICYVGDSITHGGTYHSIIDLFYATRFPDRPLQSWNCGIGGDRASGIMGDVPFRLNIDILSHKPTVATIMLGMNDVGGADYAPDQTGPEVEKRRQASLDIYDANMRKLIDALQKSGARVILITPSIYDETTKLASARPVTPGRNGALTKCAEKVQAWSKEYKTGLVKFHEVMNVINHEEQVKDPTYTLVGADRVHPGPVGHFVMAYTFLKAQGIPAEVARIAVDAKQGKASGAVNCELKDVKKSTNGLEFDCVERALPFVPPSEAQAALALVPFMRDLNRETLVVAGLANGSYQLKIDGQLVGEYPAAALQEGIDLAQNEKTPQFQQAAAAKKNYADRMKVSVQLRNFAVQFYGLSRAHVNVTDRAAVEKALRPQVEAAKAAGKAPNAGAELLLAHPDEPAKSEAAYAELTTALRQACQPRPHHFSLVKK